MRPLLLDLFCCEGGAAMGYYRAGFDVIGVDIVARPKYPFPFIQADALAPPVDLSAFDAIHASPPCQAFSVSTRDKSKHLNLIPETRALLAGSGLPYVIENVPGAPVRGDIVLCGSMFGLISHTGLAVRRHRYFETSWVPALFSSPPCQHTSAPTMSVCGNGPPTGNRKQLGRNVTVEEWRTGMGMPWASRYGLAQSIPPAYTEHIGKQMMEEVG
jgi:DNA (cytosine-5)-methyltransferase 1